MIKLASYSAFCLSVHHETSMNYAHLATKLLSYTFMWIDNPFRKAQNLCKLSVFLFIKHVQHSVNYVFPKSEPIINRVCRPTCSENA